MLVQCPKCRTTYRVSDEVFKGEALAFRCSRCRHTFELESPEANDAAEPNQLPPLGNEPLPSKPAPEQELSFSFTAAPLTVSDTQTAAQPLASETPAANRSAVQQARSEAAIVEPESSGDATFAMPVSPRPSDGEPPDDAEEDYSLHAALFPSLTASDGSETGENILSMSSYKDQQVSIAPYMTLFALLIIGFCVIAALTYAHPKTSEGIVKWIPLLGSAVLKNSHFKDGILIRSLRASYQNVQGNREIFIVTGVALNQNPVVIREIRIKGKVYNEGGKELDQQIIWVGNTISPKIIRGMTTEDIPHLQNLKPLKSFEIPPGDSVPFTIVFLKSAKAVKNYSCEVVAASA